MARITVVDDDMAAEILVDGLRNRGHVVERFPSAESALASLARIADADVVVLDVIMETPASASEAGVLGPAATAGMTVYRALRRVKPRIPILVYSASQDRGLIDAISGDPGTVFMPRWGAPTLREVCRRVESMAHAEGSEVKPVAFIVHGHDDAAKFELKNFLQNTLGFPEPVILHEQPNSGRTIIEKFEDYAASAHLAFVIMTADDPVADPSADNSVKRRARQNVIFELGYFLAAFGRRSGRVFLLHRGPLDLPTDLAGLVYIDISDGVSAAGEQIRRELEHVS